MKFVICVLVTLHSGFKFSRPLTVTGYWKDANDVVIEHQMVVDRVENNQYVIQNTNPVELLRIPLNRNLYIGDFNEWYNVNGNFVTDHNMEIGQFYLGRSAFTVEIKLP